MKLTLRSYLIYFLIWACWILTGTLFYAYYDEFGWSRGIYYAVNVGYSIGWSSTNMIEDENSKIFSIFYLISGVVGLAVIVVYIAGIFLTSKDKWYTSYLKATIALRNELTTWEYIEWWYDQHQFTINMTALLLVFIVFGVTFSCIYIGWDIVDGIYFTLATLSTAGLNSLPDGDTPDWMYGVIGVYAAIGVIIQMIVVFYLAGAYLQVYHHNRAEKAINEKLSEEELRALREMGLEDEATVIDRHEFLLLMIVRLGLIDTEMIAHINQRFDDLDTMRMHKISIATLLGTSEEDIFDISLAAVSNSNERSPLVSGSLRSTSSTRNNNNRHRNRSD